MPVAKIDIKYHVEKSNYDGYRKINIILINQELEPYYQQYELRSLVKLKSVVSINIDTIETNRELHSLIRRIGDSVSKAVHCPYIFTFLAAEHISNSFIQEDESIKNIGKSISNQIH